MIWGCTWVAPAVAIVDAISNAQICTKWFTNDRLDAALEGMLDSGLNIELGWYLFKISLKAT